MSEENKSDTRKDIKVSGFSDSIAPLVERDLNLSLKSEESDSLKIL